MVNHKGKRKDYDILLVVHISRYLDLQFDLMIKNHDINIEFRQKMPSHYYFKLRDKISNSSKILTCKFYIMISYYSDTKIDTQINIL